MDRKGKPTPPEGLDLSARETSKRANTSARAMMAAAQAEPVPDRLKILAQALGEVLETPPADRPDPSRKRRGMH